MIRGRVHIIIAAAVISSLTVVEPAHAGGASTTWYVSNTGSGTTCSSAEPCSLDYAVAFAQPGTTVIVRPGNYGSPTAPISTTLNVVFTGVTIEGQPGAAMPVIYSEAGQAISVTTSRVSRLDVEYSGTGVGVGLAGGATADHVVVNAPQALVACDINSFGTMKDSVCHADQTGVAAIDAEWTTSGTATIQNVTAVAGDSGAGLAAQVEATSVTANLNVTNAILIGGRTDINPSVGAAGSTLTINTVYCDYKAVQQNKQLGTLHGPSGVGNLTTRPTFIDATHGKFKEAPGSATINRGIPIDGADTDLAGLPRTLGSAPDIGAYEFPQRPAVTGLTLTKRTVHSLSFKAKVNPQGLATIAKLTARHHGRLVGGASRSVGSGRAPKTVRFKITHLHAHRTFHVRVSATNKAGVTRSRTKTAKTRHRH